MNQRFVDIWEHPLKTPVLVGLVSGTVGAVGGYIFGVRRASTNVHVQQLPYQIAFDLDNPKDTQPVRRSPVIIDADVYEEIKSNGAVIDDEIVDEEIEVEINDEVVVEDEDSEIIVDVEIEEEVTVITHNVFAQDDEDWDFETELKNRRPDEPYVIHKDEFFSNEFDLHQVSLEYFEGDDILVDDHQVPVYNYREKIGDIRFGHGSGDPNVFYVRNEKLGADYEIVRNRGHYAVEVLDIEIEHETTEKDLKHSKILRFRSE